MRSSHILAIDQGTTSSRAIVFDEKLRPVAVAQQEFPQYFPAPRLGRARPGGDLASVLATCRAAHRQGRHHGADIAAIGITNQRETTLIWERDDRQADPSRHRLAGPPHCRALRRRCATPATSRASPPGPACFSTPISQAPRSPGILDAVAGARERAACGEFCFGTVDSFLIWRLTGGKVHATDATNASRTLLLDIHSGSFEDELLALFAVPRPMLPEVKDCATLYGTTAPELFGGAIAIRGVAGDQQAATIGQACFAPGMMKSTYGTGCFALLNTGRRSVISRNRLLTTIAYQLSGERTYALEGSIFVAGAAVQWLRDGLGIIPDAGATAKLAAAADPDQAVYLVPAFVGLGAPWWDAEARGASSPG